MIEIYKNSIRKFTRGKEFIRGIFRGCAHMTGISINVECDLIGANPVRTNRTKIYKEIFVGTLMCSMIEHHVDRRNLKIIFKRQRLNVSNI